MVEAVDHINLVVRDLERSVKFYTEVLGMRETKRAILRGEWIERIVGLAGVEAKVAYVVAPAGEPRLELLEYRSPSGDSFQAHSRPNTVGLRHVAFRVRSMEAALARLRDHGVPPLGEPTRVPGGIVKHDAGEKCLVYFLDPDGVLLELAEYSAIL
jgi:catechol 2,3-dioxygenase-like lactoylglutathione lyase family enzyme